EKACALFGNDELGRGRGIEIEPHSDGVVASWTVVEAHGGLRAQTQRSGAVTALGDLERAVARELEPAILPRAGGLQIRRLHASRGEPAPAQILRGFAGGHEARQATALPDDDREDVEQGHDE